MTSLAWAASTVLQLLPQTTVALQKAVFTAVVEQHVFNHTLKHSVMPGSTRPAISPRPALAMQKASWSLPVQQRMTSYSKPESSTSTDQRM